MDKIHLICSKLFDGIKKNHLKSIAKKQLNNNETNEGEIRFEKLTPIDDVDLKIYEQALDFVFKNDDIKNVAISGAYSSGKSSVVETYKKLRSDFRFINISLAHFESVDAKSIKSTEYNESILEGKILNQLIHKINPKRIPQTNFKIKRKVPPWKIACYAISSILFIVLSIYIGYFDNWSKFVVGLSSEWLKSLLKWSTKNDYLMASGIYCTAFVGLNIYYIIKAQINRSIFRRVKTKTLDLEIEIFAQSEESYFDKHLNEVLYLFESSNADVIVFEDMDRYNSNLIFEKLREINTLVNNNRRRPIRFFYLLRDDVFISKDRTKFFDFIIPIVPVVDASNSYDKFVEYFKQGGIFELFDEEFLQGLSLYIDDMRLLKNIYNEFIVYHGRIQSTDLTCNKLLAIITYKNIFPRDFNELQLGMGFVHTLFDSKTQLVEKELPNVDKQIQKLEDELYILESELLESIDELDATFLLMNFQFTSVGDNQVAQFKTRAELIRAIKENQTSIYRQEPYYGRSTLINLEQEINGLLKNPNYVKRRDIILAKCNGELDKKKQELQNLRKQKIIIKNRWLKDFITRENIDSIFSVNFENAIGEVREFKEIKGSPYFDLIKYLIRNGYMDETYPDYMTYFYENSISRTDKIFLRSITDQRGRGYSYALKEPSKIIKWLRIVNFDCEEILNFDLLCHMLETEEDNIIFLQRFLQQLKNSKNIEFVREFLFTYDFSMKKREPIINVFIKSINSLWPRVLGYILLEGSFSKEQIKHYIIYTFYFSSHANIIALNEDDCITEYISNCPTFLDINSPDINKIIDRFISVDVKFKWIDTRNANPELFRNVYKNNLYELNFTMISLMLEEFYGLSQSSDFNSKNFSLVISKREEPLAIYIKKNMDSYINIILQNCNGFIIDEEIAVLEILNNWEVDNDNKAKYIEILETVMEDIQKVEDTDLWSLLLRKNLVKYSVDNILRYFFANDGSLDDDLIQFINGRNDELDFDTELINSEFGEKGVSTFFDTIVSCNELTNERYGHILQVLKMPYNTFTKTEIVDEKVLILIDLDIIRMSEPQLLFIRDNYPGQLIHFITHNISDYIGSVINQDNFDLEEMLMLLSADIDDEYKIELLELTTEKISIIDKEYSSVVEKHILEHNLREEDIPFLFESYLDRDNDLREIVKRIAVERIEEIIENRNPMPPELLADLFISQEIDKGAKKRLFGAFLPSMDVVQAREYLRISGLNDFLRLLDGGNPKFKNSDINKFILSILEKREWISSYDKTGNGEYCRAYGRRKAPKLLAK